MIGIKETIEVLKAVVALKLAWDQSNDDGKFDLKDDSIKFIPAILPVIAAVDGIGQIKAELDDLDDAEIAALDAEFGKAWRNPSVKKIFKGAVLIASGILDLDDDKEVVA